MCPYLEAVDSLGYVDGSDIHKLSVLSILMVSQEGKDWDESIRMDQHL